MFTDKLNQTIFILFLHRLTIEYNINSLSWYNECIITINFQRTYVENTNLFIFKLITAKFICVYHCRATLLVSVKVKLSITFLAHCTDTLLSDCFYRNKKR